MSIRPDPAQDLVGYLRWLGDKVEALDAARDTYRICATEAARRLGYHPRYFHGRPDRIPGFGLSSKVHTLTEWVEWLSRPEAERRAEWDAIPTRERRQNR